GLIVSKRVSITLLTLFWLAWLAFSTGKANATPQQDQVFYNLLAMHHLTPHEGAISLAHQVCADVWTGTDPNTEVAKIWRAGADLTWDDATHFVADSIIAYCAPVGRASQGGTTV